MLLEESSITRQPDLAATVEESGEEETFSVVTDRDIEEEEVDEEEDGGEQVEGDENESTEQDNDDEDAEQGNDEEDEDSFLSQPVRKPKKNLKRLSTTAPVNQKSTSFVNPNTLSLAISQTLSSSSQVYIWIILQ